MSHFCVMVIGPNIDKQLAPYQENNMGDCPKEFLKWRDKNGEWHDTKQAALDASGGDKDEVWQENPNRKWDWYVIGGRWGGYFRLKPGKKGKLGDPSTFDRIQGDSRDKTKVDQALKGDIDFDGMRAEEYAEGLAQYDAAASLFPDGKIPQLQRTWQQILNDKTVPNIDEKRKLYHAQPAAVLKNNLRQRKDLTKLQERFAVWGDLEDYACTREEFAQRRANGAISTYAVLKDGQWFAKGEMGWFGMSNDELTETDWLQKFNEMIDALPDDTLLTVVDCHI